jgi:hypothetical protein
VASIDPRDQRRPEGESGAPANAAKTTHPKKGTNIWIVLILIVLAYALFHDKSENKSGFDSQTYENQRKADKQAEAIRNHPPPH